MLKKLLPSKKKASQSEITESYKEYLSGPFFSFTDFEVGDIVTVKNGVVPGGRINRMVEEVGEMRIHGEIHPAIRVMGMPYFPEELILVKKRDKARYPIHGLWQ